MWKIKESQNIMKMIVACWKSPKFPIPEGKKKENLKNSPKNKSIVYNKLLIDLKSFLKSISRLLWYIFLFLTEHNPSLQELQEHFSFGHHAGSFTVECKNMETRYFHNLTFSYTFRRTLLCIQEFTEYLQCSFTPALLILIWL